MMLMFDFSWIELKRNCALLQQSMSDHVEWSLLIKTCFDNQHKKCDQRKSRDSRLSCNKDMRFVVSTTDRWSL